MPHRVHVPLRCVPLAPSRPSSDSSVLPAARGCALPALLSLFLILFVFKSLTVCWAQEKAIRDRLDEVLTAILTNTEVTKSVNKNNGEHAVLFEAVSIVIKQAEVRNACALAS